MKKKKTLRNKKSSH